MIFSIAGKSEKINYGNSNRKCLIQNLKFVNVAIREVKVIGFHYPHVVIFIF